MCPIILKGLNITDDYQAIKQYVEQLRLGMLRYLFVFSELIGAYAEISGHQESNGVQKDILKHVVLCFEFVLNFYAVMFLIYSKQSYN